MTTLQPISLRDNPETYNYYATRIKFPTAEARTEFERLTDDYLTEFRPSGRFELDCIVEMAHARWELDIAHNDDGAHIAGLIDEAIQANPTRPENEIRVRFFRRYDWKNDAGYKFIQGRIRYWRSTYNSAYNKLRTQQAFRQQREEAAKAQEAATSTPTPEPASPTPPTYPPTPEGQVTPETRTETKGKVTHLPGHPAPEE